MALKCHGSFTQVSTSAHLPCCTALHMRMHACMRQSAGSQGPMHKTTPFIMQLGYCCRLLLRMGVHPSSPLPAAAHIHTSNVCKRVQLIILASTCTSSATSNVIFLITDNICFYVKLMWLFLMYLILCPHTTSTHIYAHPADILNSV